MRGKLDCQCITRHRPSLIPLNPETGYQQAFQQHACCRPATQDHRLISRHSITSQSTIHTDGS
ncbi:hypothetical protein, partial [Pseudomonas sp. NBRC 111141]